MDSGKDKAGSPGSRAGLAGRIVTHILAEQGNGAEFLLYTFFTSKIPTSTIEHIVTDLAAVGVYAAHTVPPHTRLEEPVVSIYICWSENAKTDAESRGYVFRA